MATISQTDAQATADALPKGIYHFLDVGGTKYGECILLEFGSLRILIDGSHVGDIRGSRGYRSIPEQLKAILGGEPPFDVSLVVVTHCHADHVGCLPELVGNHVIRPRYALLTDPHWGFGRTQDEDSASMDARSPASTLAALLREEDATDLSEEELSEFIDAVETVESRYNRFVATLQTMGVDVSFHRGGPLKPELAQLLRPTGITLIGPSQRQLVYCAEQISKTNREAEDAVADLRDNDAVAIAELYRRIIAEDGRGDFANPRGNGMNCQSITFAFGPANARVLLAGDMQFAEPGVADMDDEIAALRRAVIEEGPYKLFKTTHHTSHNGQDDAFLDAIGKPKLIVHSGGIRDTSHPYPAVLKKLQQRDGIHFARTDRNGLITVKPHESGANAVQISKGTLNDFSPNVVRDVVEERSPAPTETRAGVAATQANPVAARGSSAGPQIIIVNLPPGPINLTVAGVDIEVRSAPGSLQPETVTPPGGGGDNRKPSPQPAGKIPTVTVAPERELSELLFVVDPDALARNIGSAEAAGAMSAIEDRGGEILKGPGSGLIDRVHERLKRSRDRKGIILLGGYDVVPTARRDVLDEALRDKLGSSRILKDGDQFWVWSDSSYGDLNGDRISDFPVSRIPDGRDAGVFLGALSAPAVKSSGRFGVHNIARPFASAVWDGINGTQAINMCETFGPDNVSQPEVDAPYHYYMLHGQDDDATRFLGETADRTGYPAGFNVAKVPGRFNGVVFSGCCWGALIVKGKAVDHPAALPPPRMAEESIALSYLKAGATAFIGCTGMHYSGPSTNPDDNYAMRLHQGFWHRLNNQGESPSQALFNAKQDFAGWIVSAGGQVDALDTARRLKNLAQFTCLGFGW